MIIFKRFRLLLFASLMMPSFFAFSYEIEFKGDCPEDILTELQSVSELVLLQDCPTATQKGLENRAAYDIKNLLQVLHSHAYFNALIDIKIHSDCDPPFLVITIETGPVYPIGSFQVVPVEGSQNAFLYESISLCDLGITLGSPAFPKDILNAEENLLLFLADQGYPLARIEQRKVIADQATQSIHVILEVNSGCMAFFGPTRLEGNCKVLPEFFTKKIAWRTYERYNPCKVNETQAALEASGLFTSVQITNSGELEDNQELPMIINVVEGKQRSIGWGLTYNTQRGPGVTFEWEHRNIRGLGEKFRIDTDIWPDQQGVYFAYITPDYKERNHDLLWLMDFEHETTKGYTESSFSLSRMLERQMNACTRVSYGLMYKWLKDSRSETDGEYNLAKVPLYLRWSNANSVLDPTEGRTLNVKVIPSLQFIAPQFAYCINTLIMTHYAPLTEDHRYVLASKITFGTIFGSNRRTIPASERFYEGSETTLRGYRYQSVSPLNDCDKPIGGRSVLVYSLELRIRTNETFGWVAFYDIGNVYAEPLPQLDRKVLQSVGWGFRYHTAVGPIRLDFAVPLNRRCHLDPRFQVYISIGQAF